MESENQFVSTVTVPLREYENLKLNSDRYNKEMVDYTKTYSDGFQAGYSAAKRLQERSWKDRVKSFFSSIPSGFPPSVNS